MICNGWIYKCGAVKDVNSFFGNLRNGENYEGFWAGLTDNNQAWMGSRSGKTFGRWDSNNPRVLGEERESNDRPLSKMELITMARKLRSYYSL